MPSNLSLARTALASLEALKSSAPDRDALGAWPGWGPLAPAFGTTPEPAWVEVADRLDDLLPAAALESARDIVDTSFFTPPAVAAAVFGLLRATGFRGGRVLEPGCGSGNFMTQAPADLNIDWTGVELDPTSAQIAALLHPEATIINAPLQKTTFRTGEFDAVVGNVPFSKATVHDPSFNSSSLHEYFTLRALDAVRPGGYVIIVTSRHMLDADHGLDTVREEADLISAVRLPSGAFDGTAVVADILVLRKRDRTSVPAWSFPTVEQRTYGYYAQTVRVPQRHQVVTGAASTDVSGVWSEHLGCVAGTLTATGYDRAPLKVLAEDPVEAIRLAAGEAASYITPADQTGTADPLADVILEDGEGRKTGSFHLIDGAVMQVAAGRLVEVPRASKELRALIPLRDAAVELIRLESDPNRPDADITAARQEALTLYTRYVNTYGALNRGTLSEGKPDPDTGEPTYTWRRPSMGGFRRDPDSVAVLALEQFDQNTGEAAPAPILLRRVGAHPTPAVSASSAEEALAITLGECGRVNLDRIARLLGVSTAGAEAELGDLIFTDPATGKTVTARDYLSGNIRTKLAVARTAAASADPRFSRNVAALAQVMPAELGPLDIRVQLGASWVTEEDVNQFTAEIFGGRASIRFTPPAAFWENTAKYATASYDAALSYGTSRFTPFDLLMHGLNGTAPVVTDDVPKNDGTWGTRKVRNQQETLAAEEKLRAIQERFTTWVWEDPERSNRLCTEYNRRFNSHVVRRGDGSYLSFPGLDPRISLWSWQRDAVDRIVSSERTMIAHPVGSGKTLSMTLGAVTLRRLGLARKPLIIVPGHLLEQIAREAQQAYPTGKFLMASKEDLTGDNRRLFAARCATGDWDAVVMTHQAFSSIGVDPSTEQRWLQEQKAEYRQHLQDAVGEYGMPRAERGAKQIATAVRKLEERISTLRYGLTDPNQITFEQLGIDHISADEAHYFRRLDLRTTRGSGFSMGSSKRATDLLLKIDTLALRHPDKPVVALFTGTPWSNTLAETYVWQRYLQPERLREAGVEHFDTWAATFVRFESKIEVTPDGSGFRMYRRPAVIQNLPELRLMLAEVADLLTADAIGLERPDAVWDTIVVEPGDRQREFVQSLSVRADAIRNGGGKRENGGDDNMLLVCTDGRKAALDPRLVGIDEDSRKVEAAAARIARIWAENTGTVYGMSPVPGTLQLVLSDIGTPHPGDSQVYGRLKHRLAQMGVPTEKIRFIHEAKTDRARTHLFAQCREGAVSVLIGSTDKVGVGTNIQTRLSAVHHLDAPWRPSDVEQREGRALRPGNLNKQVTIYRYVTEGSFDSFLWQAIERKQRFISQLYTVDGAIRDIEDVSEAVLNYAEVKALAAGNPKLLRQAELASEVRRLRTMRAVHGQDVKRLQAGAEAGLKEARQLRDRSAKLTEALSVVTPRQDAQDLEGFAKTMKDESGFGWAQWRGLNLRLASAGYGRKRTTWVVDVEHRYSVVHTFTFVPKQVRLSVPHLAATVAAALDTWLAQAPAEPARLLERAAGLEANAAQAAATAGKAVFELEGDLLAAERELAEVDAAINGEVEMKLAA